MNNDNCNNSYYNTKQHSVNSFDIADYAINYFIKINKNLSLKKLLVIMFFFQIITKIRNQAYVFEDAIIKKNNFIEIKDINKKYGRYKNESLTNLNIQTVKVQYKKHSFTKKILETIFIILQDTNEKELNKIVKNNVSFIKAKEKENIEIINHDYSFLNKLSKKKDFSTIVKDLIFIK